MSDQKRVYGIDLGTTYSCIASVDDSGRPTVYANSQGDLTTPSVVYFESETSIVVGQDAKDVAALHPELVVSMVKRCMGNADWKYDHAGQSYRPEQISAFILRKVVQDAEVTAGAKIEDVVITCPAYFGVNQKEATKQAGKLAGLNVLTVIPEPTAAAIAFGLQQKDNQAVLVYDLGGGTFDVTAITIEKNAITVIATDGNHQLGGGNWDDQIVNHFASSFELATGTPSDELLKDADTYQALLLAAEKCKKALSAKTSVKQPVQHGTEKIIVELTREKFDEITRHLLDETITILKRVLEASKDKKLTKFDKVLLVGGSTYMPQVQQRVKLEMPCEVLQTDPNQIVAKGAAMYGLKCEIDIRIQEALEASGADPDSAAGQEQRKKVLKQLAGQTNVPEQVLTQLADKEVTNVSSKSFGVAALDDANTKKIFNLVCVDDQVPAAPTQNFVTSVDRQISVDLDIYENVSRLRGDDAAIDLHSGTLIGKLVVGFDRPLPRGTPIQVAFTLDRDGLLSVIAREATTGRKAETTIKTGSVMDENQLNQATSQDMKKKVS